MQLFHTLGATALFAFRIIAATNQEEIVAKVNGDIITRSELEKVRSEANALRDRVDHLLLVSRAHQLEINVDGDIARTIARVQAYSKLGDPDKFHQWIYERIGMTFEDWKQQETESAVRQKNSWVDSGSGSLPSE